MTASLLVALLSLALTSALGCSASSADSRGADAQGASSIARAQGEFFENGSCQVTIDGAPLFSASDSARATYDTGAVADIAPAGYALHQLACAPAGADPALTPERADERMTLVLVYVRTGASLRPGRYVVHAGMAEGGDTVDVGSRAGVAIFGSRALGGAATGGASRAGVRYLEARDGTLEITRVEGAHVGGRFDVRARAAWSM